MLLELKVSNFAIIDNLHIRFKSGLNILSGETGSGKSVLLKSLALLMGGKASADMIRPGQNQSIVEGCFDISKRKDIQDKLQEHGIDTDDDQLIIRRLISSEDKSRIYLNGTLSPLSTLRDLVAPLIEVTGPASPLIEMTGQHENKNLMSKFYHLDLLDHYCGTWEKRHQFETQYNRLKQIDSEIHDLQSDGQNKAQRLDFLLFQKDEIEKLDLSPGEDLAIESEIKKLKNASRLSSFVTMAEATLYEDDDSAKNRLKAVLKKSAELMSLDPALAEKVQGLEQAQTIIDDVLYSLRGELNDIESDPNRLEELESRLSALRKLQKKYGTDVNSILHALVEIENEVAILQNSEQRVAELQKEQEKIKVDLKKLGNDLHNRRNKGSELLTASVNEELSELNMKGVLFSVHLEKSEDFKATGLSDVEFMTRSSAKDTPRPLSKFASGGELSRILLSLKRVVGSSDQPRTYLFDEVDTGVSGETAEKVGKKLKSIAKGQQVICVTHLPQVAACGDHHFYIQKSPQKDSVSMDVTELKSKDRVREIARLISGEKISKTSLAHAEELLGL